MRRLILLFSLFLVGCSIAQVKENFPRYGNYCGWGYSANWTEGATKADAPKDIKDAICWLHDTETRKANQNEDYLDRLMAQNTASKFFNWRLDHMDEMKAWADAWWTAKVGEPVDIPIVAYDKEWASVYKPGSRRLFGFLYRPELRDDSLLDGSVDETLVGPPPKPGD